MKLKFKIQQYQTDAVQNVVKVFNGQPNKGLAEYIVDKGKTYIKENGKLHEVKAIDFDDHTGYKNGDVVLSRQDLLNNIHQIQAENNIRMSSDLVDKLGCCQLDIEMETGTGKTYVYIKTMFELNKLYGWTKFIVVVPSVAIREGVKKSFDITGEHFMELYGKKAEVEPYPHEPALSGAGHLPADGARHGPQRGLLRAGRRGAGLRSGAADPLLCGGARGVPEPAYPDLRPCLPCTGRFSAAAQRYRGKHFAHRVRPVRHL